MTQNDLVIGEIEYFFQRFGIRYSQYDKRRNLVNRYFNFRLKYIGLTKRKVKVSEDIFAKILSHPCKDAFYGILYKTGEGLDLNPYQSKGAFDSDVHDGLFNDWGIHHLHLSDSKQNSTDFFYDRSDYLLFVRFTEDEAYFLDIQKHREVNIWSKRDFIRIIQRNWPESIADKEVPGTIFSPDLNDNEIGVLRKKGYLFGINVDGKGYLLLGHGQTSSGDNMMAVRLGDQLSRWLVANQPLFERDQLQFRELLKQQLYL